MVPLNNITTEVIFRLRKIARELVEYSDRSSIISKIKDVYGIEVDQTSDPECVKILYESINRLNPSLVRDCGIKSISFEDMGPSKEYYPNHGKYINDTLILNDQLLKDPTLLYNINNGSALNKFDQTLYHELGHGWDETQGGDQDLSLGEEWMTLSGWSKYPKPGKKRIRIREKGTPEIIGEYYYSPEAKFTRFYAKRNPWDDWADTFSYYVGGLNNFLPNNKVEYFDNKLKKYQGS